MCMIQKIQPRYEVGFLQCLDACSSQDKQELGNIAGFQRLLVVDELFLAHLVFSCIFELAGVA